MAIVTYSWTGVVPGFTLNGQTAGDQSDVAITATADGGYLGAWSVGNDPVRGRFVDADGTPGAEQNLNTTQSGNQFDASMALLGNGHTIVSFTDSSSGTDTVRIRILGDGAPFLDFAVPADDKPLRESDVAALGDGGFAVAYTRDYGSGDADLLVQRYEADGDGIGGPISVDGQFGVATDHASIAGLASGGFVVAWEQSAAAGGNHSVWFQLYNAAGVPVSVPGDMPGSHHLIDGTGSINQDIQIAALQDGGFVVAYVDNGWVGANGTEITAQIYNADGTARSGFIKVNTDTAGDQLHPTVTVLSNGFFVVGWTKSGSFFYQAYDPSGAAVGPNHAPASGVTEGEIVGLADGLVASVQESFLTDGDGGSVRTSIDALVRTTSGTADDETLTGDSLRDVMNGAGGSDILDGGNADDDLRGGEGDDVLRGSAGADELDGGTGTDTASYYSGAVGVTVSLAAGTALGGEAAGDTLSGIENLSGSQGNDDLTGDAGANRLQGWNGDDALRGGAGADVLEGGAGIDAAVYLASVAGVTVDLAAGTASGGDAEGDTLTGIENVQGGQGNNSLTGNSGANTLWGWIGDDLLRGDAGADHLVGSGGTDTASYYTGAVGVTVDLAAGTGSGGDAAGDTLVGIENLSGSQGSDTLLGNADANWLRGWNGDDTLRGGTGADTLDGGAGVDTASYYNGSVGVTVDLVAGTGSGGNAAGDTLTAIENVSGSQGGDTLLGSAGANWLRGWDGDDVLRGGAGADTLDGGAGIDTASYYNGSAGVSVSLTAGTGTGGEASADILSGIENVSGSQGNDILVGNADANVLRGWDGDDVLNGVAGQDTLTGGIGADRFVLSGAAQTQVGAGADLITDFSHAQADKIDLHLIDANTDVAGDQTFSFIGTAAYSGVAGQLRYAASGGVTTLAGDVDGDGTSDFHIKLAGSIALVAADFVL